MAISGPPTCTGTYSSRIRLLDGEEKIQAEETNKRLLIRGAITKKNGKIWEKFPIRLDPPPSDNSEYFEFQKLLKNSDPPPSDQIQKSLKLRTY